MITQAPVFVRPAEKKDRSQLANMIHFEPHVHRHLDWRPPLDWLGYDPYIVAEKNGQLIAALACPPDPPGVAWIRMFATTSRAATSEAWNMLWPKAQEHLKNLSATSVAAIPLQQWFKKILEDNDFKHVHNVLALVWDNTTTDLPTPNPAITLRKMQAEELDTLREIDEAAFGPIWRNSLESIRLAFDQAVYASVAEDQGQVVGFQISTASPAGAHLARLAVHPEAHKKGVGYALVRDLLTQFEGPQARRVSVNTQDHNLASLALYKKAGFVQIDEKYPVYQYFFS